MRDFKAFTKELNLTELTDLKNCVDEEIKTAKHNYLVGLVHKLVNVLDEIDEFCPYQTIFEYTEDDEIVSVYAKNLIEYIADSLEYDY